MPLCSAEPLDRTSITEGNDSSMILRLRRSILVAGVAFLAGGSVIAQTQDEPTPGIPQPDSTHATVLDSAARAAREAEEAARDAAAASTARQAAIDAERAEAARLAEIANRARSEYAKAIAREWQALDYVTFAFVDLMPDDSLLRIVSSTSRRSSLSAPYSVKARAETRSSTLPRLAPPTVSQSFQTDSTVEALVEWYARRYGFEFVVHRTRFTGLDGNPDTLVVARAVRRIGNTMISLMIFNPTQSTSGRKKAQTVSFSPKTTVSLQERCYRSREELIVEGPDALVEFTWKVPFRDLITRVSNKYMLDPYLVAALVQQESGFNAGAMSEDSAMGLTQMIPGTADMMGVRDPSNPRQSLEGGMRYLKLMLQRFKGDVVLALAAYNAGPGNVEKYRGVPPFEETRDYVKRIMARYTEKAAGRLAKTAKVVKQRS